MSSESSSSTLSWMKSSSLKASDQQACHLLAAKHLPNHSIQALNSQGGCSLTFRAVPQGNIAGRKLRRDSVLANSSITPKHNDDTEATALIIQFRLPRFALSQAVASQVNERYLAFSPTMHSLQTVSLDSAHQVQMLTMSYIAGQRFSDLQPRTARLDSATLKRMEHLLRSFSTFFARQWETGTWHGTSSVRKCSGKVGSTLLFRLDLLSRQLPTADLRARAEKTRMLVEQGVLDVLPLVLTHGDLLPSNIVVHPETWGIEGYVDWAEAEILPFGMSLYGVEHLLGTLRREGISGEVEFVYYEQARRLREVFWRALEEHVEGLRDVWVRRAMEVSRDVGVLLWRGIAWDDGAVDRVVDRARDANELVCLEAFLAV